MAQARKFANLPDLVNSIPPPNCSSWAISPLTNSSVQDTEAPDVYETPELTEDATTAVVRYISMLRTFP